MGKYKNNFLFEENNFLFQINIRDLFHFCIFFSISVAPGCFNIQYSNLVNQVKSFGTK